MDLITIKNLSYLDRCSDISLKLGAKKLVGIVGPNGAGKSTLLKLMAGLIKPTHGEVLCNGRLTASMTQKDRASTLSWVPQISEIGWPISVYDAIMIGAQYQSTPDNYVKLAIECCHLQGFEDRPLDELSGGELARVWVARALANTPKILLADEPMAALDIKYQIEIMNILKGFAYYDCLAVVVIHDINLALRFCDEVIVMHDGKVKASGTPVDVMTESLLQHVFDIDIKKISTSAGELFFAQQKHDSLE